MTSTAGAVTSTAGAVTSTAGAVSGILKTNKKLVTSTISECIFMKYIFYLFIKLSISISTYFTHMNKNVHTEASGDR